MPFRGQGQVLTRTVKCQEPKTRQQKVQLYYEDDPLCPSGHIIYLLYSTLLAKKTGGGRTNVPHPKRVKIDADCKKSRKNIKFKMFYTAVLVRYLFGPDEVEVLLDPVHVQVGRVLHGQQEDALLHLSQGATQVVGSLQTEIMSTTVDKI